MKFFYSHCHVQLSAFDADREAVLARMREHGVGGVVVGTDLDTSRQAIELAHRHDFLWASVGLHPNDPSTGSTNSLQANSGRVTTDGFDAEAFSELARDERVVAIGECGLDYSRIHPPKFPNEKEILAGKQKDRFQEHINVALKAQKPLVIHCRPSEGTLDAHQEILSLLGDYSRELENGTLRAVMHFFTSTADMAQKYLALGCYISFPCVITFTDMYDEAVHAVPLNKILSETDSPFAAPASYRGRRNEPIYVEEAVRRIAELKNLPFDEISAQILRNSRHFFGI